MLLCAKGKILLKNDKTDFTQGRILPKLAFFMLPILGALVLQAAYGAVDLLVVGRFGSTSGLSAVSTGSQVLNLVTFVVTQLAMGVTVLIARYLGEKRPQYIGQVIGGAAIVFTLLAAALFVVLVFFARLISSLMQAPAEALDLTASYVRICGSGIFFIVAYNMLSALFRGLGDSRSPLIFVLVACIVNVIGDLVLVAGFHLDAAGAAIATVAAHAFIGYVGLHDITFDVDFAPAVEIGWRLIPEVWNQGYATEAASACLEYAKKTLGLKELYSFTSLPNKRSERVMQKTGMVKSKEFDHPLVSPDHPLCRHVLYKISLINR